MSFEYDEFDMLKATKVNGVLKTSNVYDYRGRRLQHKNGNETTDYYYSGGTVVAETKTVNGVNPKTTLFYRGSDMGGGVGGINYAEYKRSAYETSQSEGPEGREGGASSQFADGTDFNYKFYNLRGDVIMTLNPNNTVKSASRYYAFGTHDELVGSIATDRHRANTKVEDSDGLLNEGHRFRSLDHGVFLTPDPLEYVDGLNMYVYVGQNPWGRFDPLGLESWATSDVGTGSLTKIGIYLETFAAFQIYRKGDIPRHLQEKVAKENAYLAVKMNIIVKKNGEKAAEKTIVVGRQNVLKPDNSAFEDKVRGFLIDYNNQVNGTQMDATSSDVTAVEVNCEYRFIAGQMPADKFGPNGAAKINQPDPDKSGTQDDIGFYAADNAKPYVGDVNDFGKGSTSDSNTIDKGSFNYRVKINPRIYPDIPEIAGAKSSSDYGLSKYDENGNMVPDKSGYKPSSQDRPGRTKQNEE